MAKNNKYNKRLVTDDEPTTELEALTLEAARALSGNRRTEPVEVSGDRVAGALSTSPGQAETGEGSGHRRPMEKVLATDNIGDFNAATDPGAGRIPDSETQTLLDELQAELASRAKTIDRLRFANEQLLGRRQGLEAELKARQDIVDKLHRDSHAREDQLIAQRKLLKTRDGFIEQLKNELRHLTRANGKLLKKTRLLEREYRSLRNDQGDRGDTASNSRNPAAIIGGQAAKIAELRSELRRTEDYASKLRAVLFNRDDPSEEPARNRAQLRTALAVSAEKLSALEAELQKDHESCAWLRQRLAELNSMRAREMKAMQANLDETQEALAEAELATQELASDLVETRDYRDRLSGMLKRTEDQAQARINELELNNSRLITDLAHCQEKLDARGRAINDLLAELAKKPQRQDSDADDQDAPREIDQRASSRVSEQYSTDKDRFTRLLVGTIDGQEIRFPLFKNRLTIGRSSQNDIQLEAAFVSRRHAVLVTDQDKARIVDWGSRNGVYVNSDRISEHFLDHNDVITIGVVNFRYEERPKREN